MQSGIAWRYLMILLLLNALPAWRWMVKEPLVCKEWLRSLTHIEHTQHWKTALSKSYIPRMSALCQIHSPRGGSPRRNVFGIKPRYITYHLLSFERCSGCKKYWTCCTEFVIFLLAISYDTIYTKGCFPVQYASMNEFTCFEHSVRIPTYVKKTHH